MVVPNSGLGAGPLAHIKSTSVTFVIGLSIHWANIYHLASTTEPVLIIPKTSPDFNRNFLHNHWGSRPRVPSSYSGWSLFLKSYFNLFWRSSSVSCN